MSDLTQFVPARFRNLDSGRGLVHGGSQRSASRVQSWKEDGWLFAAPTGEPVNPRTDHDEWQRLLKPAGVREALWRSTPRPTYNTVG